MTLGFDFIGSGLGVCGALAVNPTIDLNGRPVKPFLYLVQSPFEVFTLGECLPEMLHFFVENIRIATNWFWPDGCGY